MAFCSRFSMVAAASLPHYLLADTTLGPYHFKKGTLFFANLSKFMNDPNDFPNPRQFDPTRFIDENNKIKRFDKLVPFGIGKRICMGESLAKNELFIFFTRTFQRISVNVIPGSEPNPEEFIAGITRIPKPFPAKISART